MKISRENLLIALYSVIEQTAERERILGYFSDSSYLASLRETYATVMAGEQLELVD